MKSLKYALALGFAAAGTTLSAATPAQAAATQSTEASVKDRVAQAVQNICHSYNQRHGKDCSKSQRRQLDRLFTAEIARGPYLDANDRNARLSVLQRDAMAVFGMTALEFYDSDAAQLRLGANELADEMCERYEALHAKKCDARLRQRVFDAIHGQLLRGDPAPQEEEQRVKDLHAAVGGAFGMTYEQFSNPPGGEKNRMAFTIRRETAKVCAEVKQKTGKDCTAGQRAALKNIFETEAARGAPQTTEELVDRTLGLVNAIRRVFDLPPVQAPPAQRKAERPMV